jgi:hypothetical protein
MTRASKSIFQVRIWGSGHDIPKRTICKRTLPTWPIVPRTRSYKHDLPKCTQICKVFSQICLKFFTNLWKLIQPNFINLCKTNLACFTSKYSSKNCFKVILTKTCPTKLHILVKKWQKPVLPNYIDKK